jgi:uncharacterized protein YbjT (DUF2867 family)
MAMNKTILVLGATGMLGEPVARQLKGDGFQVKVFTRDVDAARESFDPSYELIPGDLTDKNTLARAMEGSWGVHISVGGDIDRLSAEQVAAVAPNLGVARIGYVSGATAFPENSWFPMTEQALMAEDAIRACGVAYTIFCPTWTMEQLPRFVRGGKPFMIGKQPKPVHWFAAEDMARMVSKAFQRDAAENKRFFIYGPEGLTMKDALNRYCQALYPDGDALSVMPVWLAKGLGALTRNDGLKFAADLMGYFDKIGEMDDPTEARQILGPAEITLDAWITQRKGIGL